MSALTHPAISPEEYLRRERAAEFRSEYHRGQIVAMSGTTRDHSRIVTNITSALNVQLKDRPCNNYSENLRVGVQGGQRYLYPDIVVTCGPEEFQDQVHDTLLNPVVIVEVLSPSTEGYDRGEKFLVYQSIPTLREYVLASQSSRRLEAYRKQPDGSWVYHSIPFSPPPLVLQSIDCTLTLDEVYSKVDVEPIP